MKQKATKAMQGVLTLNAPMALFADGDDLKATEFVREIGLTGKYETRKFALDRKHFEQVIANHKASGVDPAVDLGHESMTDASKPAAGWVRELSIRPSEALPGRDALVARFTLNDIGQREVQNQHFRYLSMGINLNAKNKQTGEAIGAELDHLALVKRPFIEGMKPLSLSAEPPALERPMKTVAVALGLSADADEADALAVINPLRAFERDVLAIIGKASHGEAIGVLTAIKNAANRAEKADAELVARKAASLKAEIASLIDKASDPSDGRLSPAKRDETFALADKIGLDGIKAYLAALPKQVGTAAQSPVETSSHKVEAFSADEIYVARMFVGDDPNAIAERIKAVRAANVNPLKQESK